MLFKSQLYIKCLCYTNSVSMLLFVTKSYFLLLHNILLYEQSKFCLSILLLKGLHVVISCGYYGYTWPSLLVSMSTRLSWGCVQQGNWYDMKCVCVCVCVCIHAQLCPTLCNPMNCSLPVRLLCSWNFSGKNTRVCWPFLLQGIFPAQGSKPRLLQWQMDSSPLCHLGRVKCV